jgi:transposase-like protein
VDVRLAAAVTGGEINVAAFCREHGVSRDTFYRWRNRYRDEGLAGLEPRSSTPKTSPGRTSMAVEDTVVALRKELDEVGLDAGAGTIQWHLGRRGTRSIPSVATIWRDPRAAQAADVVVAAVRGCRPQRAVAGRRHQMDYRGRRGRDLELPR